MMVPDIEHGGAEFPAMLTFDLTLPRHRVDYAVTLPAKVTFLLKCYHRLYGTKREGSSGAEFPAMLTFDLTLPRHRVDYAVTLPAKVTFLLKCYHRLYGTKREGSSTKAIEQIRRAIQ
ncbi:hypothetical protein J6590_003054 [Homalodisca vitripennis]|nr:hypothetical protein J6590_003054 [Homalodisca vitripennis]